jgi:hypothetical protein
MPWCREQYSIDESRAWLEVHQPCFHSHAHNLILARLRSNAELILRDTAMRLLFAFLFLCLSAGLTLGQAKSPGLPSPQGELFNLIKNWNEAELKGDAAEVAKLLAPEFSFLGGSSRKEYLSLMKPDPSLLIESATIDEADIQVYENSAVVTSVNSFKVKKDGRPLEGKFLSLTVWIKRDSIWQCVKASMQPAKE